MTVEPVAEDVVEREWCAALSRGLGEPLPGTAPTEAGVLVVEQPGPWGRDAVAESGLRPLAAELGRAAADAGLKLLVVRRRTRRYDVSAGRLAWVSGFTTGARFLERLDLADPRELLELSLSAAAPTGAGTLEAEPLVLACTHSTRDACCARIGLPLARGMQAAGLRTWHSSHLGGHRFAPTCAVLPHGLWLGRVDPDLLPAVATALRDDRVPIAHLRGRAGLSPPAQVADWAVRDATGLDGLDALTVRPTDRATSDGGGDADGTVDAITDDRGIRGGERFRVTADDGRAWTVDVGREPTGTVRALSCGGDAKREDPGHWVTDVARDDAAPGPRMDP